MTTVTVPCSMPVGTAFQPAASTRRTTSSGTAVVATSISLTARCSNALRTAPPTTRASSPSRSSIASRSLHLAALEPGAHRADAWLAVTWSSPARICRSRYAPAHRSNSAARRRTWRSTTKLPITRMSDTMNKRRYALHGPGRRVQHADAGRVQKRRIEHEGREEQRNSVEIDLIIRHRSARRDFAEYPR